MFTYQLLDVEQVQFFLPHLETEIKIFWKFQFCFESGKKINQGCREGVNEFSLKLTPGISQSLLNVLRHYDVVVQF